MNRLHLICLCVRECGQGRFKTSVRMFSANVDVFGVVHHSEERETAFPDEWLAEWTQRRNLARRRRDDGCA